MSGADIAPVAGGTEAPGLRIATYNIHKGVSSLSWRNRIHDLRSSVERLNVDIVFLQEVQGRSERHAKKFTNWPAAPQHEHLAGERFSHAVYAANAMRSDGDHGNALLSRYPMLAHENLDVSDHRFEQRGILHCELDMEGKSVHCLCAHLGLFEGSRKRQAEAIIERIRTSVPDDAALIIAGDFNDWRNSLGHLLKKELGMYEVFEDIAHDRKRPRWLGAQAPQMVRPARTFPAAFPMLRLDRVYVRGFSVRSAAVMHGRAWRKLSDHAPIVAELVPD